MNKTTRILAALFLIAFLAGCGDDEEPTVGSNNTTANNNTSTSANNNTSTSANNNTSTSANNTATGFMFRTDEFSSYTRVDALGQPAVSTALVPAASKSAYNDDTPNIAAYAPEMIGTLTALHGALDDEIGAFQLTPCSMDDTDADGLPDCLGQDVTDGAGPLSPANLVLPDTLKILDASAAAGYPNGRRLQDPVIDIILSVILLDQSEVDPDSIVGVLNPAANDANGGEFQAAFPYLNPPFEAM